MTIATLRPGLLVSLSTSCRGNVNYQKIDLETEHADANGEAVAKWETTRTIADRAEHEAAKKAQNEARAIVTRVCNWTAFGLLCPEADAERLERAMSEARAVVDKFNSTARLTRLNVYIMAGRIASDDVAAVRAINGEVRELLEDMARGVERLDVATIRAAAKKAKEIGGMLSPNAEAEVRIAIDTARAVATRIVAAGEAAQIEIDTAAIRRITESRTAFLDMSDDVETTAPATPKRALDFDPADPLGDNAIRMAGIEEE